MNMLNRKNKLKKGEKIPLCYDECAKIMFADPEHLEPLILLLSNILQVKYEEIEDKVELIPLNTPNEALGYKKTERDIVVYINNEIRDKLIIEVNISKDYYEAIMNKSIYYMNEVSGKGLKQGDNYDKVEPTFLICFNTFYVDKIHNKMFDYYYWMNDEGNILTDKQKILNINIEDCYTSWYNDTYKALTNIYEKDLLLLSASMYTGKEEEFNRCISEISTSKDIKKVIEEVSKRMNEDEELKGRYYNFLEDSKRLDNSIISDEKRKSKQEGIIEGIIEGEAIGIAKNRCEMVVNLYSNDVSLDIISKSANLSLEEVQEIINSSKIANKCQK